MHVRFSIQVVDGPAIWLRLLLAALRGQGCPGEIAHSAPQGVVGDPVDLYLQ